MSSYLRNFFVPVFLFLAVLIVTVRLGSVWESYKTVLVMLPAIVLLATAVIAMFLLQYAYVYTALLLTAVYALIQLHLQTGLVDPDTYISFLLVNMVTPLALMGCVLLGRKPLFSIGALSLLALMSSLLWLPYVSAFWDPNVILSVLPDQFYRPIVNDSWFGIGLLVTYLPVAVFLVALYVLNPTPLQAQWIVALLALLVMFVFFSVRFISSLTLSVLGFSLLIALLQDAFQLAFVDELTGIPARKALQKQLLGLGRQYSVAMLDVDHFKKFNDTYGHDVGDQVLRLVAAKINQVSGGGKAYRYGGEEFTILFPGKRAEQTLSHLDVVREAIANYAMHLRDQDRPADNKEGKKQRKGAQGKTVHVTISIGVAERRDAQQRAEDVIKAADKALYAAKKAGRNCVKAEKA